MLRTPLASLLVALSASAVACEGNFDAVFENTPASEVLAALAEASGYELQNAGLATGVVDAKFEHEQAHRLLPVIAADRGFRLRIEGRKAWLEARGDDAARPPLPH